MKQRYTINLHAADAHDYDTGESGPLGRMILDGVLVPDNTLAHIADARNVPWQWGRLTQDAIRERWNELASELDEVERGNP